MKTELDLKRAIRKAYPDKFLSIEPSPGSDFGLPDLLYMHKDTVIGFVELKRTKHSRTRKTQELMFRRISEAHKRVFIVYWHDDNKHIVFNDFVWNDKFVTTIDELEEHIQKRLKPN